MLAVAQSTRQCTLSSISSAVKILEEHDYFGLEYSSITSIAPFSLGFLSLVSWSDKFSGDI